MELRTVRIEKPEDLNFILGHSHFIKTVEDLHETLAQAGAHLRFGLAFCESSGPCLIRRSGNDAELVRLAVANAGAIGAGHSFIVFLEGGFPVSVLDGGSPLGVETETDVAERKALLRHFGYKL
jgi:adenosine/AMP kinase